MSSTTGPPAPRAAPAPSTIPTGNTYDKYGSDNPLVRRLMRGFQATLDELLERAAPRSLLDVGCGEGVLLQRWALRFGQARCAGVDLDDPKLAEEWAAREAPNLTYRTVHAGDDLPFAADEFDLVTAIEVLEHVEDPRRTLAEMARCAERQLLVSVPRDPVWRLLNLARGAYVRQLGNTPGHLNHWSKRAFVSLLGEHGEVVEARSPFPWTMLLVRF